MLSSIANPETLDTWKAQYRHKLALLLLVYLLVPSNTSSSSIVEPDSPNSSSIQTAGPTIQIQAATSSSSYSSRTTPSTNTIHREPSLGGTHPIPPIAGPSKLGANTDPIPSDNTLTIAFDPNQALARPAEQYREPSGSREIVGTPLPVRRVDERSTLKIHNTRQPELAVTPPLSDPPPRASASTISNEPESTAVAAAETSSKGEARPVDESECPIDFRGRPMCPGVVRQHPSFSDRSAEISSEFADAVHEFGHWLLTAVLSIPVTLSPLFVFFSLIQGLLLAQLAALVIEDAIVRTALANPLPANFPRGATLSKRVNRLLWRAEATWKRFWRSMSVLVVVIGVVAIVARECHAGERLGDNWLDVPFAKWTLHGAGSLPKSSKKGPLRDLVTLEVLSTVCYLMQPIKHLLPASILPATFAPPSSLHPPVDVQVSSSTTQFPPINDDVYAQSRRRTSVRNAPPPNLQLDTPWLISLCVEVTAALFTLLQLLRCAVLLPTFSPFHLSPHLIFHIARGRLRAMSAARQNLLRTIECLHAVFKLFPEEGFTQGQDADTNSVIDEPDWICTICFEGIEDEEMTDLAHPKAGSSTSISSSSSSSSREKPDADSAKTVTVRARCRLPCGHKYHAGCLTHWFHHQTFCPVCHLPISSSTPMSSPPPSLPNSPRQPLFGLPFGDEQDQTDLYPAEVAAATRRRNQARRSREGDADDSDAETVRRRRRRQDELREEERSSNMGAMNRRTNGVGF